MEKECGRTGSKPSFVERERERERAREKERERERERERQRERERERQDEARELLLGTLKTLRYRSV